MGRNTLLVLLFLLLLFDIASTAYAVRRWGYEHEANPLFRHLFAEGSRTRMLAVDLAVVALLMTAAYFWPKDVAFVLVVVFAVVALNNLVTIARLHRSSAAAPASAGNCCAPREGPGRAAPAAHRDGEPKETA